MADTQDLKSCGSKGPCGFESRLGHQIGFGFSSNRKVKSKISSILKRWMVVMVTSGCMSSEINLSSSLSAQKQSPPTPLFFKSPEEAIPKITELLLKEDWKVLSRYYDLAGSKLELKELESGRFFLRTEKPPFTHPAGFWKYKHPFAPGFHFDHIEPTHDDKIIKVIVSIEMDQGDGMKQYGFSTFLMHLSSSGYQLLPGQSEHRLTWKNDNGANNLDKIKLVLDDEDIGEGEIGFETLKKCIQTMSQGSQLVILPFDPSIDKPKKYPFDIQKLIQHAEKYGVSVKFQ